MGVPEKTMEQRSNSQFIFSSVNYKVVEDARVARKNDSSPTFQAHLVLQYKQYRRDLQTEPFKKRESSEGIDSHLLISTTSPLIIRLVALALHPPSPKGSWDCYWSVLPTWCSVPHTHQCNTLIFFTTLLFLKSQNKARRKGVGNSRLYQTTNQSASQT